MASIPQVPEIEDQDLAYYLEQINLYLSSQQPGANVVLTTTDNANFSGGYLSRYLSVAYANSASGLDFGNNQTNKGYFATNNSDNPTWSSNAADYVYFEVNQGFGTTRNLYYQILGGRQVAFYVGNTTPSNYSIVADGVAIDLDSVTAGVANVNYFAATFNPTISVVSLQPNGVPDLSNVVLTVSGQDQTAIVPYVSANTDSNLAFVNNSFRIGNSATGNLQGIIKNNITIGDPVANNSVATFPVPTAMTGSASIFVPIRYKDGNGNVFQAAPAITNIVFTYPGTRGPIPLAFISTASDPNVFSNAQLTTAFSSSPFGNTAPIGVGYAPIANDTAAFSFSGNVRVAIYDGAGWANVVTQKIDGNILITGTVTAQALKANDVYALNIQSTNANIGNFQSAGFWLQSTTGNASFAGNVRIGDNLTVGNNAVIGGNLTIAGLVNQGNLSANTVTSNTIVANAVTNIQTYASSNNLAPQGRPFSTQQDYAIDNSNNIIYIGQRQGYPLGTSPSFSVAVGANNTQYNQSGYITQDDYYDGIAQNFSVATNGTQIGILYNSISSGTPQQSYTTWAAFANATSAQNISVAAAAQQFLNTTSRFINYGSNLWHITSSGAGTANAAVSGNILAGFTANLAVSPALTSGQNIREIRGSNNIWCMAVNHSNGQAANLYFSTDGINFNQSGITQPTANSGYQRVRNYSNVFYIVTANAVFSTSNGASYTTEFQANAQGNIRDYTENSAGSTSYVLLNTSTTNPAANDIRVFKDTGSGYNELTSNFAGGYGYCLNYDNASNNLLIGTDNPPAVYESTQGIDYRWRSLGNVTLNVSSTTKTLLNFNVDEFVGASNTLSDITSNSSTPYPREVIGFTRGYIDPGYDFFKVVKDDGNTQTVIYQDSMPFLTTSGKSINVIVDNAGPGFTQGNVTFAVYDSGASLARNVFVSATEIKK